MASLSLNIAVSAPLQVTAALVRCATNLHLTGQQSNINGQETWTVNCSAEAAYELLARLVQATGASNNNQRGMNTASSYTPAASNNNLNNLLARNQPLNEGQLLLAAADALAFAIAKAMVVAVQKNSQQMLFSPNYQWPNLPLRYLLPLDKSAQTIYLLGRVVELPPMLLVILEKLLVAPANTIVNIRDGFFAVTDNAWNVHMHKLRFILQELIKVETVKMKGYRLSINTEAINMPFAQRCVKAQAQLENVIPMEV